MIADIWFTYFYQPLFNFLILMYNTWTEQNLGWAIIWMTVLLRLLLLPFTLLNERNRIRNRELAEEVMRVNKSFANDPIAKKEEIRKILKKRKVQPWAKAVVLGIQGLVLVLLYQVFVGGIKAKKMFQTLYPSVDYPGEINTMFFGFDLGAPHSVFWAGLVAVILFVEIYVSSRRSSSALKKTDLLYFIAFPGAVGLVLWWLPAVKALFMLTTIIFSLIVAQVSKLIFRSSEPAAAGK